MAKTASSVERGEETTMANVASCSRKRNRAAVPFVPDEIILWEILVRLPAKELLRCRAACRSWRRLTSDPALLLAHHRRQPSLPLVEFTRAKETVRATVDAFDLRRSPAVRRPVLGFNIGLSRCPRYIEIHASCDGLLLMSFSGHDRLHLCNPATRQWLTLPDLHGDAVAALYTHRPSGEYRILYWEQSNYKVDASVVYYVLTVGSSQGQGQARCIGLSLASVSMKKEITSWTSPSVLLHDCLHWHHYNLTGAGYSKIVIFDTVAESFRWMQPPTVKTSSRLSHLLQIDGTLGLAHIDVRDAAMTAEVWVLQDYEKEVWSLKLRIKLPGEEMRKYATTSRVDFLYDGVVVSANGDVLLAGRSRDGPYYEFLLFHCDGKGKLVEKFVCDVQPSLGALCFKESLVSHGFFKSKDGKRFRMPRSLRGLY